MALILHLREDADVEDVADDILTTIELGASDTWAMTSSGKITYSSLQWRHRAYFKCNVLINDNEIRFSLSWNRNRGITNEVYSVYHGRFAEFLMKHFNWVIASIEIKNQIRF